MKYIMLFICISCSLAVQQNCTAFSILNNKINSCQRNNITCSLFVYTNEFNKCPLSLTKLQKEWEVSSSHLTERNLRTIGDKQNNTCIYLEKCYLSCKTSITESSLVNCYKNCFTIAYNCPSLTKKTLVVATKKSSYKLELFEVIIVSIIVIWFGLVVIKYTCFRDSFEYKSNKIHITTFTNV